MSSLVSIHHSCFEFTRFLMSVLCTLYLGMLWPASLCSLVLEMVDMKQVLMHFLLDNIRNVQQASFFWMLYSSQIGLASCRVAPLLVWQVWSKSIRILAILTELKNIKWSCLVQIDLEVCQVCTQSYNILAHFCFVFLAVLGRKSCRVWLF